MRKNKKHISEADQSDELIDKSDLQVSIENNHQLTRLMLKITPESRLILWLFIVDGYSHAEIAAMHGKTESFSKSIVSRALKKLSNEEPVHEK